MAAIHVKKKRYDKAYQKFFESDFEGKRPDTPVHDADSYHILKERVRR